MDRKITRPSRPQSPFACDPGKGIIRGRNGDQRPREMNSGAPGKKCGGMKGGQGLINVYRGSCYQNPQPPFLPLQPSLIPLLQKRLKIYSVGSFSARTPFVFKEVPPGKHSSSAFSYNKTPSSFYYSSANKVDPFEGPTLVSDHSRGSP